MAPLPLPQVRRTHRLILFAILALGTALRCWAFDAGAPFRLANDEPFVVGTAMRIITSGDFNPHFFQYGGLSIYLHAVVGVVWFLIGAVTGRYGALDDLWIGELLPASRAVTAVLGSITPYVVYRIGLRSGTTTALAAALVMAILPQSVREAHYGLTDTPLTLLIALVLLGAVRAAEGGRLRAFAAAGAIAGLAAAVKYNGGVALLMPLIATMALPGGRRLAAAGAASGAAIAAFLVGAPYTVLDLPAFLNDFASLAQSYNQTRPFGDAAITYVKYLRNWLSWPGVVSLEAGYLALALAAVGAYRLARRHDGVLTKTGATVVLVFPGVWFAMLSAQGSLQYGRYLLPLAPALSLAIGSGLTAAVEQARRWSSPWRWCVHVGLMAVLLLPAGSSIGWVREYTWLRTEELAAGWILDHVPADTPVVIEAVAVILPPGHRVVNVGRLVERTPDAYLADGLEYVVSTAAETERYFSRPDAFAAERAAYQQLVARADVVAVFETGPTRPGSRITILRLRR